MVLHMAHELASQQHTQQDSRQHGRISRAESQGLWVISQQDLAEGAQHPATRIGSKAEALVSNGISSGLLHWQYDCKMLCMQTASPGSQVHGTCNLDAGDWGLTAAVVVIAFQKRGC